jgi:excisionase family DNA binding protein
MPQDFYTLEEAAQLLGLSREKLVEMANRREIRAFMDRGTMRFRRSEVEELARRRGLASDVELKLGDSGNKPKAEDVFPFRLGEEGVGDATEILAPDEPVRPAPGSDSDVRLVPQGSDVELTMEQPGGKPPSSGKLSKPVSSGDSGTRLVPDSDSDVKLVPDEGVQLGKPSGESGVRLDKPAARDVDLSSPTEELDLDRELAEAEKSSLTPFRLAESSAPAGQQPPPAPASTGAGDSIFDTSSSEELALDLGGSSGINVDKPSDRGLPLEESSSEEEALTFELSDVGTGEAAGGVDTSSEFELSLDDDSGLAPLEQEGAEPVRTDMVLPEKDEGSSEELPLQAAESSGEIALDTSDFELAVEEGESGSEVVVLDEEVAEEAEAAEEVVSAEEVAEEVVEEVAVEEAAEPAPRGQVVPVAVEAPPAEWGWWSLVHLPTAFILLLTGFLLYEMLRSIWGYSQPTAVGSRLFDLFTSLMK